MEDSFKIRRLNKNDAPYMLEWMHDKNVTKYMSKNFNNFSIKDCHKFIEEAQSEYNKANPQNLHFAISNSNNDYLGTVTLKNINNNSAEFAITICSKVMGTGCASQAMKEILSYGNNTLNLNIIYWYVNENNIRAINFYDKNNYLKTDFETLRKKIFNLDNNTLKQIENAIWYNYNNS